MGDPETEVVMPRLQTDLVALFAAMNNGTLADANISFGEKSFATVVAVSSGYPGNYEKNIPILLPDNSLINNDTTITFHCGTKQAEQGIVTNGGRVLTVTSSGENIQKAAQQSLAALEKIHFEGMYYRKDIGYEFN
jgi:phosphoribosylamine--glycine ligase